MENFKKPARRDYRRELAENAFGEETDRLYQDRSFAFAALESNEWKHRFVAIGTLQEHWEIPADIMEPVCKKMFENDEHIQVRLTALTGLGKAFQCTFDSATCRYLARIVLDESYENRIRNSANKAIEEIRSPNKIENRFLNIDADELIEQCRAGLQEIKNRNSDALLEYDPGLMNELAKEEI